jgi:hypothetical protein
MVKVIGKTKVPDDVIEAGGEFENIKLNYR